MINHLRAGRGSAHCFGRISCAVAILASTALAAMAGQAQSAATPQAAAFGPGNPFYAPSTLPFHAPPFNKIKDGDYQPAIDAGMAQQLKEVEAIANNPAAPTFDNTVAALEKTGQLLDRVWKSSTA